MYNLDHDLQFVASTTICPSDIRKLREHIIRAQVMIDPLHRMLITPYFAAPGSLRMAQAMAEEGREIVFDSGGYYVQIGRLSYEDLYMPLLQIYKKHRWASRYTLPDHVPLSKDTPEVVASKVRDTITYSTLFFQEMPDELKERAMPVVQGHNYQQMDECLKAYIGLGVKWIGFGSFGTQGAKSDVNIATKGAIQLAKYVIEIAHANQIKVHLFGLGAPPLIGMIKGIQADSFDSASWLKAAGYGMVSLPFLRFYNICHNNELSEFQRGISLADFEQLKVLSGHRCPLCDDMSGLQNRKMYRAAHNLIVMREAVDIANNHTQWARMKHIYENGSVKYKSPEFQKWLPSN